MKDNKKKPNKCKQTLIVFVLLLAVILIILLINKSNKNSIKKIALGENALEIGGETIDISRVISTDANPPTVGAGMIPIKWDGAYWVITNSSDPDWYNYANGKWANVMLSDGYYKSELQVGIDWDRVADKNIGTQLKENELGTIFTWIPRLAYLEDRVEFLKGTNVLDYMWKTESCFNLEKYGNIDLGFEGIWIGQTEFASETEIENRNTEMLQEENIEGLIANEQVTTLTKSEKIVAQKLQTKYSVNSNKTMLQNTDTMNLRQVIKIVNINKKLPIIVGHVATVEGITIKEKYCENGIKYITDKKGNKLENNTYPVSDEETQYTFYIIDNLGNIRKHKINYGNNKPRLTGFNKNSTFYVTYDKNGNEESYIPIGEKAPENWYNYENQQWANIVVRDNGNENYYVWIPRYMYKIRDDGSETVDVKFVDLDNIWTDTTNNKTVNLNKTDYKLPEAFTWEDPEDENDGIQLTGFWTSKYKLRASSTYIPEISGGSGVIRVNNIIESVGSGYKYEMYLIKDGKRIVYNEETGEYIEGTEPITLTGNYQFTNVPKGEYTVNIIVRDSSGNYIKAVANEVVVLEKAEPSAPDLTGFNKNLTYYVTYDMLGNEESYIPVGEEAPENWYNYDNQQWANIVVRENGSESYFVWIPRYEYKLDSANQTTNIQFISKTQETPDSGYQIPEAFTWEDPNDSTKVIQLNGFWTAKYKLRDDTTSRLEATVTATGNKIRISDIVATNSSINFIAYLIKDGKVIDNATILPNGSHTFNVTEYGTYSVLVRQWSTTNGTIAGLAKEVEIKEIEQPDLTGFRVDTTYIVTYDASGNEKNTQTIESVLKEGAIISEDKTLEKGEIDISKIDGIWYDYSEQKWANIVTKNDGYTNYFTWIPRYEYLIDSVNQKTNVILIPKTQETPDAGYQIPEAFTWEDPNDSIKLIQLSGFWTAKYKLRAKS